jgi:CBS domain-containing protein
MKVANILGTKGQAVETISPDSRIETAAQRLRSGHIGALVVSRDGAHIDGMISERDIVYGVARHGAAALEMRVSELMHRSVLTCSPDDSISHVMAEMTRARVRHLPVVVHGQLRGIVSIGDVVKIRLDETELEVHVLRDVYLARK